MKQWMSSLLASLIALVVQAEPAIENVIAVQREGTKLVNIFYDLSNSEPAYQVTLEVSADSGLTWALPIASAIGDIGEGVTDGVGNHIVWDASWDWNGRVSSTVRFGVGLAPDDSVHVAAGTAPGGTPTISEPFYISRYEVTNQEMVDVLQWAYNQIPPLIVANSSTVENATGDLLELLILDSAACQITFSQDIFSVITGMANYPCVAVTRHGAMAYCNYRSMRDGFTPCYDLTDWSCNFESNGYRLPLDTEAEYAARGGMYGIDTYYSGSLYGDEVAWYDGNSGGHAHEVGTKVANELGTYDMSGNVGERLWDPPDSTSDRTGGGSWRLPLGNSRIYNYYYNYYSGYYIDANGFRTVRTATGGSRPVFAWAPDITVDSRDLEPKTYMINTLQDSLIPDGLLSLSEAIRAANMNRPYYDAEAGSFNMTDIIRFDTNALRNEVGSDVPLTVVLDGAELEIIDSIQIVGPEDLSVSISGNDRSRVFRARGSNSVVTIKDLTLERGACGRYNKGGCVLNEEAELLFENCRLIDSRAGLEGSSTIHGAEGGAVWNSGTLTLVDCAVIGNYSHWTGGGIHNENMLTVDRCIIAGNVALSGQGGGWMGGGGIFSYEATCHVVNSLIALNSATGRGGGVCVYNGEMEIVNSTVCGNAVGSQGPGIMVWTGALKARNTIVCNNHYSSTYTYPQIDSLHGSVERESSFAPDDEISGPTFQQAITLENISDGLDGRWATSDDVLGNWRLAHGSPVGLNDGSNGLAVDALGQPLSIDLAGNARLINGTVDMGAYEYDRSSDDSDGDGLVDGEELDTYGTSPTNTNSDGDSFTDYEEMVCDTDGADPGDHFRITDISIALPNEVRFESSTNRLYTLMGCTNLVDRVWTKIPGTGPRFGVGGLDAMPYSNTSEGTLFYRIKVELP
jgi:formylglycine-generating enzyme required for sulfatase activity